MSENKEIIDPEALRAIIEKHQGMMGQIDRESEAEFINGLLTEVDTGNRPIPEPVFREIFLPYFTGQVKPTTDEDAFAHWIGLVGTATEEVPIVNAAGEVLFNVPPLLDTGILKPGKTREQKISKPFSSIFKEFAEQAMVHPGVAKADLIYDLSVKTIDTLGKEPPPPLEKNPWQGMINYYGLDKTSTTKTTEVAPGDDDLDFI